MGSAAQPEGKMGAEDAPVVMGTTTTAPSEGVVASLEPKVIGEEEVFGLRPKEIE